MANLYKNDITGKLVIAASAPSGYTIVDTSAIGTGSITVSPFYRNLQSHDPAIWHPAAYYGGGYEDPDPLLTLEDINFGVGGNLIPNSDFSAGVDNWSVDAIWDFAGTSWQPGGLGHSVGLARTGTPATEISTNILKAIPLQANKRFELTGYLASHRNPTAGLALAIYGNHPTSGAPDTLLVYYRWNRVTSTDNGGTDLANWDRVGDFFTTPATARYCYISLVSGVATGAAPYAWLAYPMLSPAGAHQTIFSDWSPGGASGTLSELDLVNTVHVEDKAITDVSAASSASIITYLAPSGNSSLSCLSLTFSTAGGSLLIKYSVSSIIDYDLSKTHVQSIGSVINITGVSSNNALAQAGKTVMSYSTVLYSVLTNGFVVSLPAGTYTAHINLNVYNDSSADYIYILDRMLEVTELKR